MEDRKKLLTKFTVHVYVYKLYDIFNTEKSYKKILLSAKSLKSGSNIGNSLKLIHYYFCTISQFDRYFEPVKYQY